MISLDFDLSDILDDSGLTDLTYTLLLCSMAQLITTARYEDVPSTNDDVVLCCVYCVTLFAIPFFAFGLYLIFVFSII